MRVREITVGDDGMATGAVYYDADGVAQSQPAEVVIMACNGVGTARLLLHSTSRAVSRTGWPIPVGWSART